MRAIVVVGEGQLLQVRKNVIAELVDDILPDLVGHLDLIAEADAGIQGDQHREARIHPDPAHISGRDTFVHHAHQKLRDQHGKRGGGEHEKNDTCHRLLVRRDITGQTL